MNKSKASFFSSVQNASYGVFYAIKNERNIRIHAIIGVITVGAGLYFRLERWEWVTLLLTIGIVISLELMNSAVEATVDLITERYHPLAKVAKDVAASAVLFFCWIAIINGMIVFGPRLLQLLM